MAIYECWVMRCGIAFACGSALACECAAVGYVGAAILKQGVYHINQAMNFLEHDGEYFGWSYLVLYGIQSFRSLSKVKRNNWD